MLKYLSGLFTGVLVGVIGTATFISYAEVMSPGTGAKFSEYMDSVTH